MLGVNDITWCSWTAQKEEERLRASIRREAQQKRVKERGHGRAINTSYLEGDNDDDDDPSVSIGALKRAFKDRRAGKFSKG